ncbi:hypothetical protein F5Y13DRAFT_183489 [Hypoxylon sp. FL1857]|nr:hypothetical protein F5Y13DRAFT_183489 [Hypoxylon sp. FL1857]
MQRLVLNPRMPCANDCNAATPCNEAGTSACGGCLLVAYCSKACQTAHWPVHRQDCNSLLRKSTWEPSYFAEGREPQFLDDDPPKLEDFFHIYLWGDVPAVDVIRLSENEGREFRGSLDILFAAPGNIRNAIYSVVNLPQSYRGPLNILVNDFELAMVARNVIFLLIFFLEDDPTMAAEYVLHIWYSALVTKQCHSMLQEKIKPVIKAVCDKIVHKPGSVLLSKTWSFGDSSLRLVLTRDRWFSLLSYFDVPRGLAKDSAHLLRANVTADLDKVDHFERDLCHKSPAARVATAKFRHDGILLPFGQRREEFMVPNPTIFYAGRPWPLVEDADPTSEWPIKAAAEFNIGPAKNDVYGKLYHYLRQLFVDFHRQLRSLPLKFEHLHTDVRVLQNYISGKQFDRIDASNLPDIGYIGVNETLRTLSPLLKPMTVNRHATLIMLFVNAINEMVLPEYCRSPLSRRYIRREDRIDKVRQYLTGKYLTSSYNTNELMVIEGINLIYDMDKYFNRFMKLRRFKEFGSNAGVQMKNKHTIIDPWPLKIPNGRPTKEARDYFALLLASGHTGQERYVEWKLKDDTEVEDVN